MINKQTIERLQSSQDHHQDYVNVLQPDLVALLKLKAASVDTNSLVKTSSSKLLQDLPTAPILTPECDRQTENRFFSNTMLAQKPTLDGKQDLNSETNKLS